ncbi:unnamed protein product [Symbiodinium pilosum]|uniref:Metalloendopeptidase n=1 Tax=Symbiodinium pilosum TaxID=2952 RepID=A0A812LJJ7_SYMPI|nr:unnamed protein product [Symbiodinium pilosum]
MSAVGSMVHEIGHAIGMNHEQKRADAQQVYNGHGPHLIMHWDNIDANWKSQYLPDTKSYIGSTNQGADDPFSGYAPYDYSSIMHYPSGDAYDTDPPANENLMGNRKHLTSGDIEQILDVYQCVELPTWTAPASCDFEDFCYWTNQGEIAWTAQSGPTPSSNTGPNAAASGVWYTYVEASGSNNPAKTAIYESPALDASASYTLTFAYHMLGSRMGSLSVEVGDTHGNFLPMWQKTGDQGNAWHTASVSIHAAVAIRFVGVTGSGWSSDIAIDDIQMVSRKLCNDFVCQDLRMRMSWEKHSNETPSTGTGPSYAHDGNQWVEIWHVNGDLGDVWLEADIPIAAGFSFLRFDAAGLK